MPDQFFVPAVPEEFADAGGADVSAERLQVKWNLGLACATDVAAELAAAKERGRRRGVSAEALREIQQLAEWAVDAVAAEAGRQGGDQLGREAAHAGRINLDRLRERVAALAPRDSGKVP